MKSTSGDKSASWLLRTFCHLPLTICCSYFCQRGIAVDSRLSADVSISDAFYLASGPTLGLLDHLHRWMVDRTLRTWGMTVLWGDRTVVTDGNVRLMLDEKFANILLRERRLWDIYYRGEVTGKTVMDVGAGQGETAWYYFSLGAKEVIAVEPDPRNLEMLKANAKTNNWELRIIGSAFSPALLSLHHDFLKMDAEGAELSLLDSTILSLGPSRIEFHPSRQTRKRYAKLVRRFGLRHFAGNVWGSRD